MKFLIKEKLSPHKYKTPEGYLICQDAILARTGKQTYRKNELFADAEDDASEVEVDRPYDEVFSAETLASFENKPVTVEHPDEDVNSENYKSYSVGFARDIRQAKTENGEDVIIGNLVIQDADTIEEILNGEHCELSCGYDCDIQDDDKGYKQTHIRGNHIALCEKGRAGIAKIIDSVKDEASYTIPAGTTLYFVNTNDFSYGNYDLVSGEKPFTFDKNMNFPSSKQLYEYVGETLSKKYGAHPKSKWTIMSLKELRKFRDSVKDKESANVRRYIELIEGRLAKKEGYELKPNMLLIGHNKVNFPMSTLTYQRLVELGYGDGEIKDSINDNNLDHLDLEELNAIEKEVGNTHKVRNGDLRFIYSLIGMKKLHMAEIQKNYPNIYKYAAGIRDSINDEKTVVKNGKTYHLNNSGEVIAVDYKGKTLKIGTLVEGKYRITEFGNPGDDTVYIGGSDYSLDEMFTWNTKDSVNDSIPVKVEIEGKIYNGSYSGNSSEYPDMADVYVKELATFNTRNAKRDDKGHLCADGKFYISLKNLKKLNPSVNVDDSIKDESLQQKIAKLEKELKEFDLDKKTKEYMEWLKVDKDTARNKAFKEKTFLNSTLALYKKDLAEAKKSLGDVIVTKPKRVSYGVPSKYNRTYFTVCQEDGDVVYDNIKTLSEAKAKAKELKKSDKREGIDMDYFVEQHYETDDRDYANEVWACHHDSLKVFSKDINGVKHYVQAKDIKDAVKKFKDFEYSKTAFGLPETARPGYRNITQKEAEQEMKRLGISWDKTIKGAGTDDVHYLKNGKVIAKWTKMWNNFEIFDSVKTKDAKYSLEELKKAAYSSAFKAYIIIDGQKYTKAWPGNVWMKYIDGQGIDQNKKYSDEEIYKLMSKSNNVKGINITHIGTDDSKTKDAPSPTYIYKGATVYEPGISFGRPPKLTVLGWNSDKSMLKVRNEGGREYWTKIGNIAGWKFIFKDAKTKDSSMVDKIEDLLDKNFISYDKVYDAYRSVFINAPNEECAKIIALIKKNFGINAHIQSKGKVYSEIQAGPVVNDSKTKDNDSHYFRLDKKKNEYDEFVVKEYVNGKFRDLGSYYTDDWQDAVNTITAMAKRAGMTITQKGSSYIAQ